MLEKCRKQGRRIIALLTAFVLTFEGMPLQPLASARQDSHIPLISSRDEDEEDYTEDAELLDDRPLGARMQLFSTGGLRASGSNASMSNALFGNRLLATPYSAFRQAAGGRRRHHHSGK